MKTAFFSVTIVTLLTLTACTPKPTPTTISEMPTLTQALPTATTAPPTPTPTPHGRTLLVTSPADGGPGTLRQAMLDAQSGDTITFDSTLFPPDSPATIAVASGLPNITQGNLTIDASNAGVILNGGGISPPEGGTGISITSHYNIIRGLQIIGFFDVGIGLGEGAQHNIIGGDRSVGNGPLGQGNLISGNGQFGIGLWGEDTSHNIIQGNYIGVNIDGTATQGRFARDGIHSNGATRNLFIDNVIGGNESAGIYLCCVVNGNNTVTNNLIGIGPSGFPLGNQLGVLIDRSRYNVVGPGNVIAQNIGDGVSFWEDTSFNIVTQNSIHENGGEGIVHKSPNQTMPQPPLTLNFDLQAGTLAGITCASCIVELFSDEGDQGEFYEGRGIADATGRFIIDKNAPFMGSHLTTTATDGGGNTSQFSFPTSGPFKTQSLQVENNLPITLLSPKPSRELLDNHIGVFFIDFASYSDTDHVFNNGFKRVRIQSLTEYWDGNDYKTFDLESVPQTVDNVISEYIANGVTIVLDLWIGAGLSPYGTTFQSDNEVSHYSDYVRLVVSHFKGRINYYEIWNEPSVAINARDYVNLVRQIVPIIRAEDPSAKIIIGAVPGTWEEGYPGYGDYERQSLNIGYLNDLLLSGVAPMVDGISWHPFYENIPNDPYYQSYPLMLEGIKNLAISQGFTGEYFADELLWNTETQVGDTDWNSGPPVSPLIAAKLFTRAIALHRGFGVNVTINTFFQYSALSPIHNINDTLAGAMPTKISLSVISEVTNVQQYAFSLPNGDQLVALWINGEVVEDDPGVSATLKFPNLSAQKVIGIDVLHGFEQELIIEMENGNLVIRNLLIKDYPIILRLID